MKNVFCGKKRMDLNFFFAPKYTHHLIPIYHELFEMSMHSIYYILV